MGPPNHNLQLFCSDHKQFLGEISARIWGWIDMMPISFNSRIIFNLCWGYGSNTFCLVLIYIEIEWYYVKEAEHQLSDKDAYKKLQHDPTQSDRRLVNGTIIRFKNDKLITENIIKGLQVQQPKTPKFYSRQKNS